MAGRIKWSQRSRNDLHALKEYIAIDSPFYAKHFIQRIIDAVEVLHDHPKIGRPVSEAERDDVREIIYQGYRILYLTRPDHVYVITVSHGSRDIANMQPAPWEH